MALSPQDSLKIAKMFREMWASSMQDDSLARVHQMDNLRATILHDDSLRVADLFNNLWAVAANKDSVLNSQSLNFYKDSFSNLIATHVGLFSALIAIAIAFFIFKYWIDNKKFDEDYKRKLDEKVKEVEKRIKSYKEIDYMVARSVYGSMIKSIMKIDGSNKCTKDLIELVNAYVALGVNEKEDGSIYGFCVVISGLFDRVLKTEIDDELSSCVVSLLDTLDTLLEKKPDMYMHINESLYNNVLEKFGTEELKEKENERKRKRDNKRPQKFLDKLKCIFVAAKTIMKGNCAAEGMENISEGAEGAAGNAKNGSEGAEGAAENAKNGSEGAEGAAGNAKSGSEGAEGAAGNAKNGSEGTEGAAGNAKNGSEGTEGAAEKK